MATDLDIVNLALAEISSEVAQSLTAPQSSYERAGKAFVSVAFEQTVQAAYWPEAMSRIQLVSDGAASPAFGRLYQYILPPNYLRLRRVDDTNYEWEREGNFILSDDPGPISVRYVRKLAYAEAGPLLIAAAGKRLAYLIARRTGDSDATRARLRQEFRETLAEAMGAASTERSATGPDRSLTAEFAGIDDTRGQPDPVEISQ